MSPEMTETEILQVRQGIKEKYDRVAAAGTGGCFQYPTGKAGMELQGYPPEVLKNFSTEVLAAFCGVGNPFSLEPLNPGDAVLDIGCGAGVDSLVAAHLVWAGGRVVGLDFTPAMVERARAHLARLGLANVTFQVGEAEALPFPDASFDAVISNGVFNLTLDKEKALREAHRVLKPGGRLLLADMVLVAVLPTELGDKVENWFQWIGGAMPGKDFLALMLKAGFHRVALNRYTCFKSSPYTEGALFYAARLADGQTRDDAASQAEPPAAPLIEPACKPGGTWKPK